MFDLRTEAEMRLHSEKTARELAELRKRDEEPTESGAPADTEAEAAADVESAA